MQKRDVRAVLSVSRIAQIPKANLFSKRVDHQEFRWGCQLPCWREGSSRQVLHQERSENPDRVFAVRHAPPYSKQFGTNCRARIPLLVWMMSGRSIRYQAGAYASINLTAVDAHMKRSQALSVRARTVLLPGQQSRRFISS